VAEHDEQVRFFDYVKWGRNRDRRFHLIFAIPNAGKRSFRLAAYMRAEGLLAGVPDICCAFPSGNYHGLWIELKHAPPGMQIQTRLRKVSNEQKEFLNRLREQGYATAVCFGADEAIDTLNKYLEGTWKP